MRGGRNCLGKDFGVEANAASFVTCSSCLSVTGVAGSSTIRVRHELQMAEMVQEKDDQNTQNEANDTCSSK